MIRIASLMAVALFTFPALAEEKQPTLAEAKAHFIKTDRDLNDAWAEAKKKLPASTFEELKVIQRDWIIYRDEHSEVSSESPSTKVKREQSPAYFTNATRFTEDRVQWLRRQIKGENESLTGLWIDGSGGTLEIVERKERLLFDFNVVRTKAYNLGVLAGTAAWNEKIGWYSDKGLDPEKTDETNIAFIQRGLRLEIIVANASHYHGHRAYFDGNYFKAMSLSAEEEAATVRAGESGKSSAE